MPSPPAGRAASRSVSGIASSYAPGSTRASAWCAWSRGVVRWEVADWGIGVPGEVKARLFEPYFSTKADGTGLGLAIVSTVVADHHGFVRVRDNTPHGTRFLIELPVRRQATALAEQARRGAYGNA